MATYNGEKYLHQQVDSILSQLKSEDELVVSDDGSSDSTIKILKSYKDSRIKIYVNNNTHGVNNNFENALKHASGDYIFLSDQDDIWLPGKVEACVNALKNAECVVHDCIVTDGELNISNQSFFAERGSGKGFWKNIYKNTYLGCCMAFRRNVLDWSLPIPRTNAFFHDNWIGCIADLKFNLKFIPYKGILFRRHEKNTSCTARKSSFSRFRQLSNRLIQIKFVVQRILSRRRLAFS